MPVQTANNRMSQADQILLAVDAEECRRSLKRFKRAVWHIIEPAPYVDGWCQDALDEHLEAVARGDIRKLVINIPPRHSKSSELLIWRAWLWTQSPEPQILAASYALSLSIRDNNRVRRILESPWFIERYGNLQIHDAQVVLTDDNNQKMVFENTKGGFQKAVSVGGGTTGHGGSYLIIDDLHNATDAHRDADREFAVTWFREVWTNRMNNQNTDRSVVSGQRIHDNDVCGYILRERPDYEHLNLPAEYEPTRKCFTSIGWSDPRTQEGDLLWPERFSAATLGGLKRDLGLTGYAAQYQQSPVPPGGSVYNINNARYFTIDQATQSYILETPRGPKTVLMSDCWKFAAVDPAISEKQSADFFVMAAYAVTPWRDVLLFDLVRDHFTLPEQEEQIVLWQQKHGFAFWAVESVAFQLGLIQVAVARGIPCQPFKASSDKVSKSSTASVWDANGKMYSRKDAPWLFEYEREIYRFPRAPKDDQADTKAMAAIVVCSAIAPGIWNPDDTTNKVDDNRAIESILDAEQIALEEAEKAEQAKAETPVDPFDWMETHGGDEW